MIKIGTNEQIATLAETLEQISTHRDPDVKRVDIAQSATGEVRVTECRNAQVPHEPIRSHAISWNGEVRRS